MYIVRTKVYYIDQFDGRETMTFGGGGDVCVPPDLETRETRLNVPD